MAEKERRRVRHRNKPLVLGGVMFVHRDGNQYCRIHPDVRASQGTARLKKKLRLIQTCEKCDELVEGLKHLKSPGDRFLK